MGPSMHDLGIDRLPLDQQIALAQEIWESLGEFRPSLQLTDEQQAELARRDAELEANPDIALTWKQIRDSVKRPT